MKNLAALALLLVFPGLAPAQSPTLDAAVYGGDAGRHYVPSEVEGVFEWSCRAGV